MGAQGPSRRPQAVPVLNLQKTQRERVPGTASATLGCFVENDCLGLPDGIGHGSDPQADCRADSNQIKMSPCVVIKFRLRRHRSQDPPPIAAPIKAPFSKSSFGRVVMVSMSSLGIDASAEWVTSSTCDADKA